MVRSYLAISSSPVLTNGLFIPQGGTYAGNAVSCAAGVAVAEAFEEEKILDNVLVRSSELFSALNALASKPHIKPHVLEVRGKGLMVGLEFASPSHSVYDPAVNKNTPQSLASRVAKRCVEKGMLILTTSVYETVRFIPPLNVSKEDLEKGIKIFEEALEEVVKEG